MILHVAAGSAWWLFAAANLILFLHIAGGTVGILSGAVALLARKGGRRHRVAGTVFFVSMLIMASIGALTSPFLPVPSMTNVAAGTLTFYLVATGWVAIKREDGRIGRFEKGGLGVALAVVAAGVTFIVMAMNSPTGTIGKTPPQAFYVFAIIGAIAAAGDLKMILRGGLSGSARIARHLWRMSAALTIASGSFFLGQQRIMPVSIQGSSWLFVPVFAPLLFMIFWLFRVRARRWRVWLCSLLVIAVVGGALFGYFLYAPEPDAPRLSGTLTRQTIDVDGVTRIYRLYVPTDLPKEAPLVVVLHGSGENGAQMRIDTGYGFERLADAHHFAVVYPNAHDHGGDWNACGTVGDISANRPGVDDVGFLTKVVDKLVAEIGVDPGRVFAAGSSRGGFMAFRLALEAPSRFRAVAAVSASVHTPDNFKCTPAQNGTSSVMIMNGTEDPLVPFDGGHVSLFGFAYKYGTVMSSRQSGQYFAGLNHIAGTPATHQTQTAAGVQVEQVLWRSDSNVQVELVAIHGGGHGIPQPYRRHPRLLGPSPKQPDGPAVIWAFFERQRP